MGKTKKRYIVKRYVHNYHKNYGWTSIYDTHLDDYILNKINAPAMFGSSTEVHRECDRLNEESATYDREIGKFIANKNG